MCLNLDIYVRIRLSVGIGLISTDIKGLTDILTKKRTEEQWEAIRLYRREKNLKKVADILNVKFQNIHKRLQSAHWNTYEKTENFLSNYITSKCSP